MDIKHRIKYYDSDTALSGQINAVIRYKNGCLEMDYIDSEGRKGKLISDSSYDLLWSLNDVYRNLGCEILCIGLLSNVYPGGLTSESTFQIAAYQIEPENRLKRKVNIFDEIDVTDIKHKSSKENQRITRENVLSEYDVGKFSLEEVMVKPGNEKVKNILGKYLN